MKFLKWDSGDTDFHLSALGNICFSVHKTCGPQNAVFAEFEHLGEVVIVIVSSGPLVGCLFGGLFSVYGEGTGQLFV